MKSFQDVVKEVLKCLGSRRGEEVSFKQESEGNVTFISVNRKPVGEPEFYVNGHGPVVDWKEKFARKQREDYEPPAFKPGEQVMVSGSFERDYKGRFNIHVDADGRIADNFFLTEDDADKLGKPFCMPLEVIVEVTGEGKYRVSDVWNYDAKIVEVVNKTPVNPTKKQIKKLKGKRVVVEGKFLGFKGKPENEWYDKFDSGLVETDDGKQIYLDFPTGKITFSDGVLENIHRKHPNVEDRIRIAAYVTDSPRKPEPRVEVKAGIRLAANWCDPCYLLELSEERQKDYDELREKVKADIETICDSLQKSEYAQARIVIGDIRALELTKAELKTTYEIVESMPEEERPVMTSNEKYIRSTPMNAWVKDIDNAYQTRLESMTKQEFVEFAGSAVTGERKQTGEHADTSYLFGITKDFGISVEEREKLLVDCIESRLPRIRGVPYDHDKHFDDKYNIDQAFKYLASLGTETSAQRLFDYLFSFVDNKEFHEIGWRENRENRPETFVYDVASAIETHLDKLPDNILLGNLRKLKEVAAVLGTQADESFTLDNINKVIAYTTDNFGDI